MVSIAFQALLPPYGRSVNHSDEPGRHEGPTVPRLSTSTTPDVDEPTETGERGWYLLVFEQQGSFIHPLPATGELVVGRAAGNGLMLEDGGASRRHFRLVMHGGEVVIEDLGSQNGTRVNGERLSRPRVLVSGDEIGVSASQLVFHREPRRGSPRTLLDGAGFRQRVEAELERSRRASGTLVVATVDVVGGDRQPVTRALGGALRVLDAATWGGDHEVLLLYPDADLREARSHAIRVLAALSGLVGRARVGLALAPDDGDDVDALIGVARAAAAAAPPDGVCASADLPVTRTIAGRDVVLADPAMVRLYALVDRLATSDLSVLISGETGSGKEIVASALHARSRRAARPFVALNCAALSETLIESQLFGHERGAFTGADTATVGLLESASGGTVLLDEVGELSPAAQAKLLRVLETQRLTRVGGVGERPIDTRVLAATHRDLNQEVAAGRFRQDLFFRLAAARLFVPPLRDRSRELSLLARVLLDEACARAGRPPLQLSPATLHALRARAWPGNVRELKNSMQYVAATVTDAIVEPWHLPDDARGQARPPAAPSAAEATPPPTGFRPIDEEVRELEKLRMTQALAASDGVQNRAAELIRMPLRTFVAKRKLYGLDVPQRGRRR